MLYNTLVVLFLLHF